MPNNNNNRQNQNVNKGRRKNKRKESNSQTGGIKIEDLKFSIGKNQIENYEKLTKHLANKAQNKCGASMAHVLINETEYPFTAPTMELMEVMSDLDSEKVQARKITDNKQKELDYQIAREEYKKETQTYKRDKEKLCGFIKEKCTNMMLSKLETESDYDSKGLNDPVWLLSAIKNKCLVQSGERHPNQLLLDAIKSLGEVKQFDKEKVKDFSNKVVSRTKSFMQALKKAMREVAIAELNTLSGSELLTILESTLSEGLAACVIQVRADPVMCGELQKNLKQQWALGQKNYKEDANEAMEVLILNQQQKKSSASAQGKQKEDEENARSFAQGSTNNNSTGFRCFKCGRKTCKGGKDCSHKNKPKSEWACMKAMEIADNQSRRSFAQPTAVDETDNHSTVSSITETQSHHNSSQVQENQNTDTDLPSWFFFNITTEQAKSHVFHNNHGLHDWMHKVIILDNQSGASLFSNKALVGKVIQGNTTLRTCANAGDMSTNEIAEVPSLGQVWFDQRAIANIIAWVPGLFDRA